MLKRLVALPTLVLASCAHVAPTPDASSENPLIGTWHVQVSIVPSEIGQSRPREVELDGDQVTLTATPYTLRGETVFNKLTWRRLR